MAATLDWTEYAARAFEPNPDIDRWPTPGALAKVVEPASRQTAALDLVDKSVAWAYDTPNARLIISMPPQEGKSQRVTKTASLWALHRNRDLRIGIVSYNKPLAEGFGRDVRNWISTYNGDDGTLDIGLRIARDNGAASRWQLSGHRGGIICVGLKGSLTGRPLDALVIDDPFADKEQADSAYYRDRVWGWWQSVGSTRLAPGAPVIVILTRWHEDDLAGRLIAAEDGARWRVVNIPAYADHDPEKGQSDPLGREPGQWLDSARGRTAEEWEAIRIQAGTKVFSALYQGRPSPDSGDVWQRPWWRRYTTPLWSQHPTVPGAYQVESCDELAMSWDMAFKDTKSSDYVVGQVWARRGANVFLLDQVRKRLTFTETLTAFKAMVARWPGATAKYVEDKANGTAVINTLKSKIPGIVEITPTESKYARANAVAPVIEAGNVFLPEAEIALFDPEELIGEAAEFPNGAHDDQVDATSQALSQLLLDGSGAQAWIDYVRRLAQAAAEARASGDDPYKAQAEAVAANTPDDGTADTAEHAEPAADPEPEDPVAARKRLRDQAFRNQNR
ncbi:phage terminase large subunit [Streptomyces sp. NPDC102487]|uniref:phage terminase large subunit n=1 Tax=Streptomyces sp. NPDC102487 TaxID=3366182 RepID=UPI00382B7A44